MRLVLTLLHQATGSYGVAIILLSLVVRIVTSPILRLAARAEERDRAVQAAMEPELREIKATSTGRERFERTEALYGRHGYHPIKSAASVLPLFLQIPFLLSALFLLSDLPALAGQPFLFIGDLHEPDALLPGALNALPFIITAVALFESLVKKDSTTSARIRFLVVALVIVVLIYHAPAGVCLYWMSSNVWSLLQSLAARFVMAPVRSST